MRDLTVSEIAAAAAAHAEAIARYLLPAGKLIGKDWCCGSIRGEPGESLRVCLVGDKAGRWKDFNEGHGGDLIDLAEQVLCIDTGDAVRWMKDQLGFGDSQGNGTNGAASPRPATSEFGADWRIILPIPQTAGQAPREHPELGPWSARWFYKDEQGDVLQIVCRFDLPDIDPETGKPKKEFRVQTYWEHRDGHRSWRWKHVPAPKPLYGIDRLAQNTGATINLCEGEKCADTAERLFPGEVGMSWCGGVNGIAATDWTPLKGRGVTVWPDCDKAGLKAAREAAEACLKAGSAEVRIVQMPPSFPEKWDLADPLPPNAPLEILDNMRRDATLYDSSEIPKKTTDRRWPAVDIESFLKREFPPRQMILSPILPTQGLMMVFARPGIGKTYLGLNIAYAISCGGDFLRWHAPEPRRILYIDGEMSGADMKQRIAEAVQGFPKEPPSSDYFRLMTPDLYPEGIPDLSTEEGQKAVDENLDGVSVVIVDNLSALCRSGRENEAESWEPMQQWMLDLKRRGICVVLIHHAGKGGMQRGTSKREDVLDTIICLRRPDDHRAEEGARFEIHFEKARGLTGDAAKAFEARMETRGSAANWTMRDIEDVNAEIIQSLTEDKLSVRKIAEETGISKTTVNRIQQRMRDEALEKRSSAHYAD
jgi:KaiC/GvpD/RAD55 family RecA-like ATPase/biotin operon repressor